MRSSPDLINSYLINSNENVVITVAETDSIVVSKSVAQVTILGPLLFNLYVIIKKITSDCQIILYTDDTSGENLHYLLENSKIQLKTYPITFVFTI